MPLTGCINHSTSSLTVYCRAATGRYRLSSAGVFLATLLLGAGVGWPAHGAPLAKSPASRASMRGGRPPAAGQASASEQRSAGTKLVIKVVDENGVAVPSAAVLIEGAGAQKT